MESYHADHPEKTIFGIYREFGIGTANGEGVAHNWWHHISGFQPKARWKCACPCWEEQVPMAQHGDSHWESTASRMQFPNLQRSTFPRTDGDQDAGDACVANGDPTAASAGWRPAASLLRASPPQTQPQPRPQHPALPFPSALETFHFAAAISRGEKGPNLALGPNLSKELIFKAISSRLHYRQSFDLWVTLTAELLWHARWEVLGEWGQC